MRKRGGGGGSSGGADEDEDEPDEEEGVSLDDLVTRVDIRWDSGIT